MRAALEAGADLINDVRALTSPGALQALAQCDDVIEEVAAFLAVQRVRGC